MKELSYKELYEQSKGIDLLRMETALEIECCVNSELTNEEYENICEFAYCAYLKSESVTLNQIANSIDYMLSEGKSVEEITDMNYWDFLSKVTM